MAANSGVELEVLIHDGGAVLSLVAKLLWLGKRKRLKRKVKCSSGSLPLRNLPIGTSDT